jgi:hypothetical protein
VVVMMMMMMMMMLVGQVEEKRREEIKLSSYTVHLQRVFSSRQQLLVFVAWQTGSQVDASI